MKCNRVVRAGTNSQCTSDDTTLKQATNVGSFCEIKELIMPWRTKMGFVPLVILQRVTLRGSQNVSATYDLVGNQAVTFVAIHCSWPLF